MVLSFDATGLPRIRGKQAPFGGWERMGVNPKVEAKPMVEKGQQVKKCHGVMAWPAPLARTGRRYG